MSLPESPDERPLKRFLMELGHLSLGQWQAILPQLDTEAGAERAWVEVLLFAETWGDFALLGGIYATAETYATMPAGNASVLLAKGDRLPPETTDGIDLRLGSPIRLLEILAELDELSEEEATAILRRERLACRVAARAAAALLGRYHRRDELDHAFSILNRPFAQAITFDALVSGSSAGADAIPMGRFLQGEMGVGPPERLSAGPGGR